MSWIANIIVSDAGRKGGTAKLIADHYAVEIRVEADSKEEAQCGTEAVMNLIAKDKMTVIRVFPESDSYTDFDTKITTHGGYARFTVVDVPGKWEKSKYVIEKIPSIGTPRCVA